MPQTISGATPLLESSQATSAQPSTRSLMSAPVQVDIYADRLMNDLFGDVEDLLSGSVPPPEPIRAKPPINFAPQTVATLVTQPQLPQWSPPASESRKSPAPKTPRSNRLQKVLAVLLGLSALSAASVWFIQRGTAQRLIAMASQDPVAIASKAAPVDTTPRFAKYLQRSLENLDRKAASNKPGMTTVPFSSKLPTTSVLGNAPERSNADKMPVVINVPPVPTSVSVAVAPSRSPQELDQVLTRLSSALERLSISPSARSSILAPTVQPAQAASSEPQRTLRGIAIATDPTQSAILFEMNGVTQRYYIGESIGSSGWSVVDISSNYVSVRRNGEVRSLSIGQKL